MLVNWQLIILVTPDPPQTVPVPNLLKVEGYCLRSHLKLQYATRGFRAVATSHGQLETLEPWLLSMANLFFYATML